MSTSALIARPHPLHGFVGRTCHYDYDGHPDHLGPILRDSTTEPSPWPAPRWCA